MTQQGVRRFVVVYMAVLWVAMLVEVDEFPLTWAPMYTGYKNREYYIDRIVDHEAMRKGFRVTTREGRVHWVRQHELNVADRHMWRLYFQRPFGKKPPHRWYLKELDWRLFRSLNKTLGHAPADPDFIVKIEASRQWVTRNRPELRVVERHQEHVVLEWKDEWTERWD